MEKIPNREFDKHSVTKVLEKEATSCASLRKKYGFLDSENPKNVDYPLSYHDNTQQFCVAGLKKVELGNDIEVQPYNSSKQLKVSNDYNFEVSNDYNFEELVNFT